MNLEMLPVSQAQETFCGKGHLKKVLPDAQKACVMWWRRQETQFK